MTSRRAGLIALLALLALPLTRPAVAQQAPEAAVKAAYLINFLNYVEWIDDHHRAPGMPMVIGIVGAEEVLHELRLMTADRTVRSHPLQVRRVANDDLHEPLHLLYVGSPPSLASPLIARLRGRAVLVVCEGAQALEVGAMLAFVPVNGRIRFEAAPLAAERAGLKLSARLLSVAERVFPR